MKYELGRLESELVFTLEGEDVVHFTVDERGGSWMPQKRRYGRRCIGLRRRGGLIMV